MLTPYNENHFDTIKQFDEQGREFWSARDLQSVLGYKEWRNFVKVVNKAKIACKQSKQANISHFADVNKIVKAGVTQKEIELKLSFC